MPTLKLMPDYECWPLWPVGGDDYGPIDPASLPITADLQRRLLDWADAFDAILNWDDPASSDFESPAAREAFIQAGEALAADLRTELGAGYTIEYWRHVL